jgi:hypothetical protein
MKFEPLTEATALPNSVHVNSPAAAQDQPTHAESPRPSDKATSGVDRTMTTIEDNAFERLVTPEVLTPGQFHEGVHREDGETRAVKRLMLAVLSDAVRCFQAYADARNPAERLRFAEAQAWILDHKAEGPFAFVTICESLGIEPNCMRNGIRQIPSLRAGGSKLGRPGRRSPANRTRPIVSSFVQSTDNVGPTSDAAITGSG